MKQVAAPVVVVVAVVLGPPRALLIDRAGGGSGNHFKVAQSPLQRAAKFVAGPTMGADHLRDAPESSSRKPPLEVASEAEGDKSN